jgi:hypothetical protein
LHSPHTVAFHAVIARTGGFDPLAADGLNRIPPDLLDDETHDASLFGAPMCDLLVTTDPAEAGQ